MVLEKLLLRAIRVIMYAMPFTALVYYHNTIFPYVAPKIFVLQMLGGVLAICWLTLVFWYPQYRPRLSVVHWALIVFLSILTISALAGVNISRSFWSTQARGIGLVALYLFYLLYLIVVARTAILGLRRFMTVVFYSSALVAALGAIQRFFDGLLFVDQGPVRAGSTFGNPAYLAAYLVPAIFLGAWLLYRHVQENGYPSIKSVSGISLLASIAVNIVVLFLANTRGSIVGFGIGAFVLLVYGAARRIRPFNWKKSILQNPALLTIFVGIIVVAAIFVRPSASLWKAIPGIDRLASAVTTTDSSIVDRLLAWNISLKATADRPMLGWGLENFNYGFNAHYDPRLFRNSFSETYFDKPHSVYLEFLSTSGILGLLSYLVFLGALIWMLFRRTTEDIRPFGLAILAGYMVQNVFIFDTYGSYLLIFLLWAYLDVSTSATSLSEPQTSPVRRVVLLPLCVLGALGAAYSMYMGISIIVANHWQFTTTNYFANNRADLALQSYPIGERIAQPFRGEYRLNFLSALSSSFLQVPEIFDSLEPTDFIDRALADAKKMIAEDPNNYYAYIELTDAKSTFAAFDLKYLEGIDADLAIADQLSPNRQQTELVRAKAAFLRLNPTAALAHIEKAINLDPEAGDQHYYYGITALQLGNKKLGFAELEKAAQLGRVPRTARDYKYIAGIYGDAQRYDISAEYFKQSLILNPDDLDARFKYAIVSYYRGDRETARAQFEEALRRDPGFRENPNFGSIAPMLGDLGVR